MCSLLVAVLYLGLGNGQSSSSVLSNLSAVFPRQLAEACRPQHQANQRPLDT